MTSRENDHFLFNILKSPDFKIIDGHIYFNNNVVKLRYDLIRKVRQYSLSSVAIMFKGVLKLQSEMDQVNSYMPLLASKFKKLVYFTQNKREFKPKQIFILPYLHELPEQVQPENLQGQAAAVLPYHDHPRRQPVRCLKAVGKILLRQQ
jgi:hypothetical protein